ncbi:MAG: translation initiation factor IF-3 [Candidatus Paracaedibacteraceae bacterium]|nr:translation initiation factor IF-3 [Candidatus Paracaedibacteraceae bacterium]
MSSPFDNIRINEKIQVPNVRFIDANGEMIGVISPKEALKLAYESGLDLVEISPNADPPVCKALDFGKYKFELQKKKGEEKKKQKIVSVKEVKLKPRIGENDYQVKLKAAVKFLEEGDKVKLNMRFRGREAAHSEFGLNLVRRMIEELAPYGEPNAEPKLENMQINLVFSPLKK